MYGVNGSSPLLGAMREQQSMPTRSPWQQQRTQGLAGTTTQPIPAAPAPMQPSLTAATPPALLRAMQARQAAAAQAAAPQQPAGPDMNLVGQFAGGQPYSFGGR